MKTRHRLFLVALLYGSYPMSVMFSYCLIGNYLSQGSFCLKDVSGVAVTTYLRDYEMFTALAERVSEGIFGFSSEEAYQRELNKGNHPSKKRKKFGRR